MITQKLYKSSTNPYPVGIQVPDTYAVNPTKNYPVIIWVHGLGGVVMAGQDQGLDYILNTGGGFGEVNFELQKQIDIKDFILVSPKLDSGTWADNDYGCIQNAYNQVLKNYRVDLSRVYLVGHSWGGRGTTGYPASSSTRKSQIAASITIAGVNPQLTAAQYSTLKDYPIWFVHDINDNRVTIDQSRAAYTNIGGIAKLDEVSGFGHGAVVDHVTGTVYNDYTRPNPKFLTWLFSQAKSQGIPIPTTSTTTTYTTTIKPDKKVTKIIKVYEDGSIEII